MPLPQKKKENQIFNFHNPFNNFGSDPPQEYT